MGKTASSGQDRLGMIKYYYLIEAVQHGYKTCFTFVCSLNKNDSKLTGEGIAGLAWH